MVGHVRNTSTVLFACHKRTLFHLVRVGSSAAVALAVLCAWIAVWPEQVNAQTDDPFADVLPLPMADSDSTTKPAASTWRDNLLIRKEVYLLGGIGKQDTGDDLETATRLSLGFEIQKRFSTPQKTVASLDYQGRLVYRSGILESQADAMGHDAAAWEYETHNAYLDVFNLAGDLGRLNLRIGYFYQPFGLNQQTDTHATLLQLSNDRLFGSDRDWQVLLYGALTRRLDYSIGYLLGSGSDHSLEGQSGMAIVRLALASEWLYQYGWEGGISAVVGERVDPHAARRRKSPSMVEPHDSLIATWRTGFDLRKQVASMFGTFTLTTEAAVGGDEGDPLVSGLAQIDWLHPSRRWGASTQCLSAWQDFPEAETDATDTRIAAVLTYFLRNDVSRANLHWIAFAVERHAQTYDEPDVTTLLIQYYRYW